MILKETGKALFHPRKLHQQRYRCLLRLLNEARRIKVGLSIVDRKHEWGFAIPPQDLTHDQSAGAVVALDVELGLAQAADLDACRTFPA
jgi:hypothetical protein